MVLEQGIMKFDNWIIVAFATEKSPYEQSMKELLIPSLEKLNIPYHIEVIESQGSWLKNVAQKPRIILNALEKYPVKNIVSVDVDAEILSYPSLFNNIPKEYDFACHILSWKEWYKHEIDNKEVLSGTVFMRNCDKMKELATKWYELATNSFEWEQKCLDKALKELNIPIYHLPIEYCYIKTLPDGKEPYIKINPVILHHQHSRKYKRFIR
jgi:hypothetical protein